MTALEFTHCGVLVVFSSDDRKSIEIVNIETGEAEYGTLNSLLPGMGVTLEDCRQALEE